MHVHGCREVLLHLVERGKCVFEEASRKPPGALKRPSDHQAGAATGHLHGYGYM